MSDVLAGQSSIVSADVVAGVEMILGRTPDPALVEYHLSLGLKNRVELGRYLTATEEFRSRHVCSGPQPLFLGDRVMARTHRGEIIYVLPSDLDLTPAMLQDGKHEPAVEQAIVRSINPGDIAVDIGANVGYHTMAIAKAVGQSGQVHAFEANPAVMVLLKASLVVNGLTTFRGTGLVTLYQNAVSDRNGVLVLEQAPGHYGSGHIITEAPNADFGPEYSTRVEVPAVKLNDVLASLPRIDFLHMDIEGAEPLAMAGADALLERSPNIRIVTEWSVHMMHCLADLDQYIATLVTAGFKFWLIDKTGNGLSNVVPSDLGSLPHCDLFISRQDPPLF